MSSTIIRKFMSLMEYGPADSATARDLSGRQMNANISYEVTADAVVAKLESYNSQIYTKLAQKMLRIKEIEAEVKKLKEEVQQEGRDHVADLFSSYDVVRTRVIETQSFIFKLTKDPSATTTFKYADVIKEFETHLTPDLIKVLDNIKSKFQTTTQKAPGLSVKAITKESVELDEGFWDNAKAFFRKFLHAINNWAAKFDNKLANLQTRVDAMNESLDEDDQNETTNYLETVYATGTSEVWYMKDDYFRDGVMGYGFCSENNCLPDANNLEATHVKLGALAETLPGTIVDMMQGENWSPNGEAREFIRGLGLSHTSMSTGDILVIHGQIIMIGGYGNNQVLNNDVDQAPVVESMEDTVQREYMEAITPMAFKIGDTIYCGSKSGKLIGKLQDKPGVLVVELQNGERDVFPSKDCTNVKPGLLAKAASWVVGEDDSSEDTEGLTEKKEGQ